MSTAIEKLMAKHKTIRTLSDAQANLNWDQEVMMPSKGAEARAEEQKSLAMVIHEKATDPEIGELLNEVKTSDEWVPHIEQMRKEYREATRMPAELVGALTLQTSKAQNIWAKARADRDFQAFAPALKEVVRLTRQKAECLAEPGQSHYDALLSEYEPEMTTQILDQHFATLTPALVKLREAIGERNDPRLGGKFPAQDQLNLSKTIMESFGFDETWSRLDQSTHPFSTGSFNDCRITTRIDENEPLGCIYSTIHEMGHALYEHNIDAKLQYLPAGIFASMGVHESQSRFAENQIGRCRPYMEWLFPKMKDSFGDQGVNDPETLYRAINHVETGFIRTEADEVHYNLHVGLRYDLERDLISGALDVEELETAWNAGFEKRFGKAVPDAASGVLQDIHWSIGAIGYFPTYTLGNIYAACLDEALRRDIPNLEDQLKAGEHTDWIGWMTTHVHKFGRTQSSLSILNAATGVMPTAEPLIGYLFDKYQNIYNL